MNTWFSPDSPVAAAQRFRAAHPMFQYSVSSTPPDVADLFRRHERFVVLGMGGSILPLKALVRAFELEDRVFLFDSLDEKEWAHLLGLKNTLFCLVSKSGETLEIKAMLAALEEAKKLEHTLIVTDPMKGFLRAFQKSKALPTLEIPPEIGGRFTNFTPLHRALLERFDLPFDRMLSRAKAEVEKLKSDARLLHTLYHQTFEQNSTQLVLWAYDRRLSGFCVWAQQAIAESLGKISKAGKRVGITPFVLAGPQDQHSVLQHLVEGPQNSTLWFFGTTFSATPQKPRRHLESVEKEFETWGFEEVKRTLFVSTIKTFLERQAIKETSQPVGVWEWNQTPESIAALISILQAYVEYAGERLDIDAFNQPGVERGKQIAREILKQADRKALASFL